MASGSILLSLIALGVLFAFVSIDNAEAAIYVKYDGIDGESSDDRHKDWIDVLSFDWAVKKPGAGATGQTRRRGAAIIDDISLTMEADKATPKLLESLLTGKVIPKLEIEITKTYGGENEETYLKYELKNVLISSYQTSASGNDDNGPPVILVSNNFEEIKVTYTQRGNSGESQGNVETTWKVEEGTK